jgi:hypothetical protein
VTREILAPKLYGQNHSGPAYLGLDEWVQKLKVACTSMRRTATPVENGPPNRPLYLSKKGDPSTPPGLAKFTLLNTLRAEVLSVRL